MRLSVREVARLFDVNEPTVYRWIAEDNLPAYEVEGQSRFHRAEVLEWATARDISPSPELFELEATSFDTSIVAALQRGGIHFDIPAGSRDIALSNIAERLPITPDDRAVVVEVLRARGDFGKTGLAEGIAIPHVRHPIVLDVEMPILTLCYFAHPVVSPGARDTSPVSAIFTLVTPSVRTHLVMLSRLAFAVHAHDVRTALTRARVRATIFDALRAHEIVPDPLEK